jgi:outer membrane protein assembly factor BamB
MSLASVLAGAALAAQVGRGGSEWLTALGDAQRTSWIRTDAKISVETMSKPGFDRQWTSKLDNQARQLNGLAQGVTANGVTLFVPMSVVTGSSNTVYAIDNDTGYVVWQRRFEAPLSVPTAACPGGITSAATRIVNVAPAAIAPPAAPRGGGRGAVGYRSLVGEPGRGVPVETRGGGPGRAGAPPAGAPRGGDPGPGATPPAAAGAPPAGRGAPAPAAPAQRGGGGGGGGRGGQATAGIPGAPGGGGPGGGFGRPSGVVYVVSSDGMLHVLGLQSGKDIQRPAPFLPGNARWSDAIAVNSRLYAATSGNCGGAPSGVWAIDLESEAKPVVSWRTNGGEIVGTVAFTSDGTLIAAIGPGQTTGDGKANAIVALDPVTMQIKDWFTQPTAEFVTGPMIFQHNEKDVVAAATRDGRVWLLDATSLGGPNHSTPLYTSGPIAGTGASIAAALATWQQSMVTPAPPAPAGAPPAAATVTLGTRWILVPVAGRVPAATAPTNGAISTGGMVALKLADTGGKLSLAPAWTSHNLTTPATPIAVNGVVFALSTGRPAAAGGRGAPAVLYAYDGASGRALWNSAKSMATFASPGSYWSAMGQVYVGTHDGTLYAFGFLDERR